MFPFVESRDVEIRIHMQINTHNQGIRIGITSGNIKIKHAHTIIVSRSTRRINEFRLVTPLELTIMTRLQKLYTKQINCN